MDGRLERSPEADRAAAGAAPHPGLRLLVRYDRITSVSTIAPSAAAVPGVTPNLPGSGASNTPCTTAVVVGSHPMAAWLRIARMGTFSASTSAEKRVMALRRAAIAAAPISSVPSPLNLELVGDQEADVS